ncbi:MAG: tRNA uridine-5-carboxymethylaminomethyl(34) synthesis GTPase MnmE [Streptococcaceae bacterium]|jgi:tRNA modification GTPase|nr:tRNA uridine-5-carboxymethylaminomethyl(34) synthesis GTPase MnmE [Streptococcaceae bacterium]
MRNITKDFDTIAAISTPPGEGAISIIRISGSDAIEIADKLYVQSGKKLSEVETHTIHYGHIVNPRTKQNVDEVMVSVMHEPRTFTREDVVEINTHGGIVVVNELLQLILKQGARLAEPGEFTKRAFLNGRIDLTEAEAVMDIIRAKTDKAMTVAVKQLDGSLSNLIRSMREDILQTLAQVEVNIDYPEYDDVEEVTTKLLLERAIEIKGRLDALLQTAKQGKILREGIATAIIGKPNVGKSSLLNHLLQEDKAIVTDIAGTTRDVIEEYVNVRGVPLKLIDTAGIRETDDFVEKIGVERSRKALEDSDLILLVLNNSEELSLEDEALLKETKGAKRIILLNKTDLPEKLKIDTSENLTAEDEILRISVLQNQNLDALELSIRNLFFAGEMEGQDATYLSNVRHIGLIENARTSVEEVIEGIHSGMPVDLVQMDMTKSWDLLGEIIGESVQDELLNKLFSQFCLGK